MKQTGLFMFTVWTPLHYCLFLMKEPFLINILFNFQKNGRGSFTI